MGLLIDGKWHDKWYDTAASKGRFERSAAKFRNWITEDGTAGPTGVGGFKAEKGRYHLYVSLACPWANRALIYRAIKGLEDHISVSVVHWYMAEEGWSFDGLQPGKTNAEQQEPHVEGFPLGDPINNKKRLHEVYVAADANYSGRVTVPLLWDKKTATIVSNESADIIRMLNSAFDKIGANEGDYYPKALRKTIDDLNKRIYDTVNNGVYKAGFATTQAAYEEAVAPLFETLEGLEQRLSESRYLAGNQITEADWRLFTTLARFDAVYVGHFKCNLKRLVDYPNLWAYTRELYQQSGVASTVNMRHIKHHYYESHTMINPTGVVPQGPTLDFDTPHNREAMLASNRVRGAA